MIKNILIGYFTLILLGISYAQPKVFNRPNQSSSIPSQRTCATVEYNEQMYIKHPELRAQRLKAIQSINQKVKEIELNGEIKSNAIVTIPVVVHVVYANAAQNISDAQIYSQINILNQDYRKINSDFNSSINTAFGNVGADCQIEFCLAQQDPDGFSTTGITRTSTNSAPFQQASDAVKYTAMGGQDAWPSTKYLNIWVCDLSNNLLGYAQFPGGLATTDGVVIKYNAFGNTGAAVAPYNSGRTATHEVGHWLSLIHIWGDDGGACVSNGGADDLVSDTPEQKDQNFGCPNYPLITGTGANCSGANPGAMFMNFMDYTDDDCMFMFTNGQSVRMNAALTTTRSSILASNGCKPPNAVLQGKCDSISNWKKSYTESLYSNFSTVNNTWGYVTGHNNYLDKAKAERFLNTSPTNLDITGCLIKFRKATASNSNNVFYFKMWDADSASGSPSSTLVSKSLTYNSIISDAVAGAMTYIELPAPVTVSSSFFAGVEYGYSAGDTLAVASTSLTDLGTNLGTAWEKWSDNSWNKIAANTTNGWGLDLGLKIIPVMCDSTSSLKESSDNYSSLIEVFPNPTSNELFVNLSHLRNTQIELFDISGKSVRILNAENSKGLCKMNTSDLERGIYILTVSNANYKVVKRIILE